MRRTTQRRMRKNNKRTMKKRPTISFEDVDYASDIDVLTIMSKTKQQSALKKVKEFLKLTKNKAQKKEMMVRKKQIESLINDN